MESSVKSLIEAEDQAKQIVQQAEKEKNEKLKEAKTNANLLLNKKRAEREGAYQAEVIKVRNSANKTDCERARGARQARRNGGRRNRDD